VVKGGEGKKKYSRKRRVEGMKGQPVRTKRNRTLFERGEKMEKNAVHIRFNRGRRNGEIKTTQNRRTLLVGGCCKSGWGGKASQKQAYSWGTLRERPADQPVTFCEEGRDQTSSGLGLTSSQQTQKRQRGQGRVWAWPKDVLHPAREEVSSV